MISSVTANGAPRAAMSNNAEIVVWQASRRISLALIVGLVVATLRVFDVALAIMWPVVVGLLAYVGLVALVAHLAKRTGDVTAFALALLTAADLTIIFVTVGLVVTPAYYVGALLLSLVALQFTQVSFGRPPAIVIAVVSPLAYLGLMAIARWSGVDVAWPREAWVLALYLMVAINSIVLHGSVNRRVSALVDLFGAAQHGDFSKPFVEERGREPDGVTQLGRAYNHLRFELANMVLSDPISGWLNRRGLDQVLERAAASAARSGGELALLAIDVDDFKRLNDTLGHLAGDVVLREVAGLLTNCSRAGDVVARVGGDDFVVLLPGADTQ